MDIVLVRDVERVGKAGQKVSVKDGFARNFLFPRGLALSATPAVRSRMEALRASQERQAQAQKAKATQLSDRLSQITCTIPVSVGEQGKLHGAVTAGDVLKALQAQGIVLEKHQVILERPLTELGAVQVPLKLHPEVTASLRVSVVRK